MKSAAPTLDHWRAYQMAVERVEQLLIDVTGALSGVGAPYAVIGGKAVAAWVSTIDPDSVRNTKDVDLLVERGKVDQLDAGVRSIGMYLDYVGDIACLLHQENPSPKRGVHLLYAGEKVRPSDPHPTPTMAEVVQSARGFPIVTLPALLRMKLIAFRKHDQVHVEDMLRVGLITPEVRAQIPADLLPRLEQIEAEAPDRL
ncbi:MAG: hypothetical protein ACKVS9_08170 [Phycisphaerae bacterium]